MASGDDHVELISTDNNQDKIVPDIEQSKEKNSKKRESDRKEKSRAAKRPKVEKELSDKKMEDIIKKAVKEAMNEKIEESVERVLRLEREKEKREDTEQSSGRKKMKMKEVVVDEGESSGSKQREKEKCVDKDIGFADMYESEEEEGIIEEIEEDEEDEELESLSRIFGSKEDIGEEIREKLAGVINNAIDKKEMQWDELSKTTEKYKKPKNVNVRTPKLNREFSSLPTLRIPDERAASVQKLIEKGIFAAIAVNEDLYEAKKNNRINAETYKSSLDLLSILTAAFRGASKQRQQNCKIAVHKKYRDVIANASSSDGMLFGEDFQKQLKEISDKPKISPLYFHAPKNASPSSGGRGRGSYYRNKSDHNSSIRWTTRNRGRNARGRGHYRGNATRGSATWTTGTPPFKGQQETQ